MPAVVSTPATIITAKALFAQGKTCRQVADELGVSTATAYLLKHRGTSDLDPESMAAVSKTLADRQVLVASLAVDTAMRQGLDGKFDDLHPLDLVKVASVSLQSAREYTLATGAKDVLSSIASEYGIEPSHSVSRITVTKSVSVDTSVPQPVVITPIENDQVE